MNQNALDKTLDAMRQFETVALNLQVAHARVNKNPETHRTPKEFYGCPKEQGALRRASLDLTRALADLRRSTPFVKQSR